MTERREAMRRKAEELLALTAASAAHVATVDEDGNALSREEQITALVGLTQPKQPQ